MLRCAQHDTGMIGISREVTVDYQPLDLSQYRNGAASLVGEDPPQGRQELHGLPFEIGEGDRAYLAFGPGVRTEALMIPVDTKARNVVFAHWLLESDVLEGGPVGV